MAPVRTVFLAFFLLAVGCGPADECPIVGEPALELGVPDSITFLDFQSLTPGGDIPLSSNGQTFLAVQVALKAQNVLEEADVTMRVSSPSLGTTAEVTTHERLRCRTDGARYLVPVVVSSEGLGDDRAIQDSMVDVEVEVTDVEGNHGTATTSGTLRRL